MRLACPRSRGGDTAPCEADRRQVLRSGDTVVVEGRSLLFLHSQEEQ